MRAIYFTSVLIITLLLSSSVAFGQLSYGVKAGVGIGTFSMSDQFKEDFVMDPVLVIHAGGMFNFQFGGKFAVQAEILFAQKGGELVSREVDEWVIGSDLQGNVLTRVGVLSIREKVNFLEIPLLLQYRFRGRQLTPYLAVGPQFGFAIGGNSRAKVDNDFDPWESDKRSLTFGSANADDYAAFDFGFSLGGGFELDLDSGSLTFDLRAGLGVSNLDPRSREAFKVNSRAFTFGIGYKFGGGW